MILQIAGVRDVEEAEMLVSLGVTDLGFPLGPGVRTPDVSPAEAASIVRRIGARARAVLITYLSRATQIRALLEETGIRAVQLHGDIAPEELSALKGVFVIKSVIVGRDDLEASVSKFASHVDAFLTDTYDPATGARGATGKTHDWKLSRRLVELSPKPVILAGGLHADNVGIAIAEVGPAGVDSHTGVEGAGGEKDRDRVKRFVEEAKRAFTLRLR